MACSCYDLDTRRPFPDQSTYKGGSPWGSIYDINVMDNDVVKLCTNGISNLVSNGCNTFFWEDLWLGEVRLKDKFLRLHSISL